MRTQNPAIQKSDSAEGRYFIRPYVDRLIGREIKRTQERIWLQAATKREAQVERARVMATINQSKHVIQAQIPFGEFLDHYIKDFVEKPDQLSSGTRSKYIFSIRKHIRPVFGHMLISQITTHVIDQWLASLSRAGLASSTRQSLRNMLSGIFTQARRWGYTPRGEINPVTDSSAGKHRPVYEPVKLTPQQTRDLLAALPPDVRLICEMALYCTCRISEIMGLQWKHVDVINGEVHIKQRLYHGDIDVVKSKRAQRTLPLGCLVDDIRALRHTNNKEDFVFNVRTHVLNWKSPALCRDASQINQHFLRPAAMKLGLYTKGFGFHAFRREAITEHGATLGATQTQRMAGHSRADMTQHYTLSDLDAQRQAVLCLQRKIRGDRDEHSNNNQSGYGEDRL